MQMAESYKILQKTLTSESDKKTRLELAHAIANQGFITLTDLENFLDKKINLIGQNCDEDEPNMTVADDLKVESNEKGETEPPVCNQTNRKHFDFDEFVESGELKKKFDRDIRVLREKCQKILTEPEPKISSYKRKSKLRLRPKSKKNSEKQSAPNKKASVSSNKEKLDLRKWPLRLSLFPNVPPYLSFTQYNAHRPKRFPYGYNLLKWRDSNNTPFIVKQTLNHSGITITADLTHCIGTWDCKGPFGHLQKICHFPGSEIELKRKHNFWFNFKRLITEHGLTYFDFLPDTFVLPQDLDELTCRWKLWEDETGNERETWFIVKHPGRSGGKEIKLIHLNWELPMSTTIPLVVQKYIKNPYLINDRKFTLRLYILVTSFDPLRVYLYSDGLVLFATENYNTLLKDIANNFIHLTNYRINKKSAYYFNNPDPNKCEGYEWTLRKLFDYLEKQEVDTKILWNRLKDISIKTIIAGEPGIVDRCKAEMGNCCNCYELFGTDILLDENMMPFLLELNGGPSLAQNPVENYVHGPMLKALLDLAQFHLPLGYNQIYHPGSPPCLEPKLYHPCLNEIEQDKHKLFLQCERSQYLHEILKNLTGDDVRQLIQAEDEFTVKGRFERIFPTKETHPYLRYLKPRYYNRLFDAWETEYENNRSKGIALLKHYCGKKIHLQTIVQPPKF